MSDTVAFLNHDELVRLEALREAIRLAAHSEGQVDILDKAGKFESFIKGDQ